MAKAKPAIVRVPKTVLPDEATMVVTVYDGTRRPIQAGDCLIRIFDGFQNQLFDELLLLPPRPNEPNKLLTIVVPAVLIMLFTIVLLATFSKVLSSGLAAFDEAGTFAGAFAAACCSLAVSIS